MRDYRYLVFIALASSGLAQGCSSESSETASGAQDIVATAPPSSGTVLLSCNDKKDASAASIAIDSSFQLSWQIGQTKATSALVAIAAPPKGTSTYSIEAGSGQFFDLDAQGRIDGTNALAVECDPATVTVDRNALDGLVAKAAASFAKEQTFASCSTPDGKGVNVFSVRPDFPGTGAFIEGADVSAESFVLHVKKIEGTDAVDYSGDGVTTSHTVSSFTTITTRTSASGVTLSWDLKLASGVAPPLLAADSRCTLEGEAFTKSLVRR